MPEGDTDPGARTVIQFLPVWPNVRCNKCHHVFKIGEPMDIGPSGDGISFTTGEGQCPECGSGSFASTLKISNDFHIKQKGS